MSTREGPRVEIRRGSWEERLAEVDREARAELVRSAPGAAPAARWALVIEPDPAHARLADLIRPRLGREVLEIAAARAPLALSAHLDALKAAHAERPLVGVVVAGTGDRADGRRAGWALDALAGRPWVFIHTMIPPSGLVPTVGEKVVRFLEVIDGIAFTEGPLPSRR